MGFFSRKRSTEKSLPITKSLSQRSPTVEPKASPDLRRVQLTDKPASPGLPKRSKSSRISRSQSRPKPLVRTPSVQTRYMEMLLHLDTIPRLHNIACAFCTWILLAGFIVFPGTFTSIQDLPDNGSSHTKAVEEKLLHTVKHLSLLWVAGACCVVGGLGMIALWFRWRKNYVWLINKIFLPGFLNSIAGLISTIVNVYTAQSQTWSITARITAIATGACTGVMFILFCFYNFIILRRVRKSHERDLSLDHPEHETVAEKAKRKFHEPALEPGSIV